PPAACAFLLLPFSDIPFSGDPENEALALPQWPRAIIRDAPTQLHNDVVRLRGGGHVHRLISIVRWRVIASLEPLLVQLLFGRSLLIAELEGERGNALADEAVLVAADEQIAVGLFVGLNLHSRLLRHRADVLPQARFIQSL